MALDANKPLLADTIHDAEAGHIHHSGEKDDSSAVPRLPHIGDGACACLVDPPHPVPRHVPVCLSLVTCPRHCHRLVAEPLPSSLYGSEPDAALLREEDERFTEPEPVPEPITPANAKDRLHRWARKDQTAAPHCIVDSAHSSITSVQAVTRTLQHSACPDERRAFSPDALCTAPSVASPADHS